MKCVILAFLAFGQVAALQASNSKGHPIAKIVTMLEEMKVEVRENGEKEAVLYQKFTYAVKNTLKELETAIKSEKEKIENLEATVESKKALIKTLEEDIEALEKQLTENEEATSKAKKMREDANKEYEEAQKDFDATIDAVQQCIDKLSDAKGSSLLAEQSVQKVIGLAEALVSEPERVMLTSFLQEFGAQPKKPEPKVYTFKSGSVVELLKKLKEKFETDKQDAIVAETASLNAHNLAQDARDQAKEAAEKSKEEKEGIKGDAETDLADAEESLKSTEDDLKANEKSLEDLTAERDLKADEWETRVKTREQEIEAIGMAIKIMAKVGGVRATPDSELIQQGRPAPSFIQIDDPKSKAVQILVSEAQKLKGAHAKSLSKLAQEISAHLGGPFDDINQMIQKMIFRLMKEQQDEDDHKNWCDIELEKSEDSKEEKETKIGELKDKIEEADARVMALAEEIAEHEKEVSELTQHIQESTEIRNEEKAENQAAIADAKAAQDAITQALSVLTDFYKEAGENFLQKGPVEVPESPATWEAGYTGLDKQPGGITSMMEKILEDYATMESDTAAQEDSDEKAYQEDLTSSEMNKKAEEKSATTKTNERGMLLNKVKTWKKSLKGVSTELEAVEQYLKDLQPACVEGDSTYEDRKSAREGEIEALKKAEKTLSEAFDKKFLFLQRKVSAHVQ